MPSGYSTGRSDKDIAIITESVLTIQNKLQNNFFMVSLTLSFSSKKKNLNEILTEIKPVNESGKNLQ